MYSLKIDEKERELKEHIKSPFKGDETLDIGDIELYSSDRIIIIERKRYDDLESSQKEGRYHNQISRLYDFRKNSEIPVSIYYLFEAKGRGSPEKYFGEEKWYGVISSMTIKYDFGIIMSPNIEGTAKIIDAIFTKSNKENISGEGVEKLIEYNMSKTKKKQSYNTVETYALSCFLNINSIGPKKAKDLQETFGTVINLSNLLKSDKDKTIESLKKIKMNKTNIENIVKYL